MIIWIGGPVHYDVSRTMLTVSNKQETVEIRCPEAEGNWLSATLQSMSPASMMSYTYQQLKEDYEQQQFSDFTLFWYGTIMEELKEAGLLVL